MVGARQHWAGLSLAIVLALLPLRANDPVGSEGPVPLYTPRPRTPIEAAGSGMAPEMRIRVAIDARGRVTEVAILGIDPSSGLDEHYEREAVDTLMRWRYYPARLDGQPVATSLDWTLGFPARAARADDGEGPQASASSWQLLGRGEDGSTRYSRYVLSLPVDERLDMLKQFVDIAEGHLDGDSIEEYATGRVIALTDAPNPEVARILADNIETTFNVVQGLLRPRVEPQPEPHKIVAVMYASERSFKGLVAEVRANEKWAGFYNPAGLLAFHMNLPSNESLTGLMLHEATHAYVDRYVARPGVVFPRWLGEGFAEYIGNSTIRKKQLVPGKTRRTEVYRGAGYIRAGRAQDRVTVHQIRDAIGKGKAIPLEEIITAGPHEFYGERSRMFYAMSWLLVHFLRHGEEGWADEQFPTLMLYVAEGYPALETIREVYGEPDDLESRFHDYVKHF